MSRRKTVARWAVILFPLFLWGCSISTAGHLKPPSEWPPKPPAQPPSISVVVGGELIANGKEQEVNEVFLEKWRSQTLKAYRESSLFSAVQPGLADTDLRAEVKILDKGEGSMGLAFLSGLTLTLLPAKASDEFIVKTTIRNRDGKVLGTYEKSELITVWIQLFLVFAMPANADSEKVLCDLSRATISEAHTQGVF